ncbi:type II toxin-antitoxin system RatA family toxin [Nitrogeniibacter aestuarii]|uniref:type II toxin-antitoxin system RatA family toxin n=1 Tax=Nitrogeniibacter aestuarii TaxID=2815343 RepID=UPI001E3A3562|nr:SRPBCC family protein [Nitrogeniibacter aestuarii]
MAIIEQCIAISAPVEHVYQVSQDYGVRYEWDPFPESIEVVRGSMSPPAIGSQVLVRSKLGMKMWVEFVQIAPPQRAAIKMIKGPALLKRFAGSWIFECAGDAGTIVKFRYSISTRPAWFAWAGDRIASAYFSWTTRKRLAGLKQYCESSFKSEPA